MKIKKNKFLIFKPSKSAMQSGLSNTKRWCLRNNEIDKTYMSSRFCWTGSSNPERQIKIFFDNLDNAIKFAEKNNYDYDIVKPNKRKIVKKSYAENFFKRK